MRKKTRQPCGSTWWLHRGRQVLPTSRHSDIAGRRAEFPAAGRGRARFGARSSGCRYVKTKRLSAST